MYFCLICDWSWLLPRHYVTRLVRGCFDFSGGRRHRPELQYPGRRLGHRKLANRLIVALSDRQMAHLCPVGVLASKLRTWDSSVIPCRPWAQKGQQNHFLIFWSFDGVCWQWLPLVILCFIAWCLLRLSLAGWGSWEAPTCQVGGLLSRLWPHRNVHSSALRITVVNTSGYYKVSQCWDLLVPCQRCIVFVLLIMVVSEFR